MRRKKKFYQAIFENLDIISAGALGQSIARKDNMVVFVEKAVPGDNVDVKVIKEDKRAVYASITKLNQASVDRVEPFCKHFQMCGGCKWQQMNYQTQLKYKHQQVVDSYERQGKIPYNQILPIIGSDEQKYYRNKLQFSFTNKAYIEVFDKNNPEHLGHPALGFHIPSRFDKVFQVEECHLMHEIHNQIRNYIFQISIDLSLEFYNFREHTGFLRDIMIRNTKGGQWMLVLMVAKHEIENIHILLDKVKDKFSELTSIYYTINTKQNDSYDGLEIVHYSGEKYLIETIDEFQFKIHPKSFFQTNPKQAEKLYHITREFASLTGNENVYDLYSGTGTISIFVSKLSKKVTGIEYVEEAVIDAFENSKVNNIPNTEFFSGDMVKVLTNDFVSKQGKPDIIITDPPRSGMHPDVVSKILELEPKKVIYVSCNPATQVRDITLMLEKYKVGRIQPVDMFPQTHHVECVTELILI